ncbi:metalloprotease, partial [Coemansia aciculifera]
NSGSYNAYTAHTETNYYFSVVNGALEGALDRFAQFFVSPLFNADCVDREINAVDSEYKGYVQNDGWRTHQLMCETSNPAHSYSWFNVGNLETLRDSAKELGLDLRKELIKFYNKYYSADIMRLVVVGNYSLDVLSEMVASKFSDVESKGDTKPKFDILPVTKNELGKIIRYKTVNEIYEMMLVFALPDINYYDGFATYTIDIDATPEGLENYEAIVSIVFGYINMLIENGPQEWYYKELSLINKAKFDYKDKEDAGIYARTISRGAHNQHVLPQHILSHNSLMSGYNAEQISKCLSYLNPGNYRLFIGAQEHKSVECTLREKHYNILHHISDMPAYLTSNVNYDSSVAKMLHFPGRNMFLPEHLSVNKPDTLAISPAIEPDLLKKDDNIEVWFKQDDQFFTPHGAISLAISSESDVSLEMLKVHIKSLFDKAYVKMLVSGNYLQSVALDTSTEVVDILQLQTVPSHLINNRRTLSIEPGYFVQNVPILDPKCVNSAVLPVIYCGSANDTRAAVTLRVLKYFLHTAFFEQIRTTEQLGYRVMMVADSFKGGRDMLMFMVEGESNPAYVTQRINHFISQYRQKLQEITAEEFESSIQSQISLKQDKLKSIDKESLSMWSHITSGQYEFDALNNDVEHLKQLRKEDLLSFWDKYFNKDTAPSYTRMDLQMWSANIWQPTAEEFEMYPSAVISLYGILHSSGHTELGIADIHKFV